MGKIVNENIEDIIRVSWIWIRPGEDLSDFLGPVFISCLAVEKNYDKKKSSFINYVWLRIKNTIQECRLSDYGYRKMIVNKNRKWINIFCDTNKSIAVDALTPEMKLVKKEYEKELYRKIGELKQKQIIVIWLYYFKRFNEKKIGEKLDLTESRISQIKSDAIKKMSFKYKNNNNVCGPSPKLKINRVADNSKGW